VRGTSGEPRLGCPPPGDSTSAVPDFRHCGDVTDFRNNALLHGAPFVVGGDHVGRAAGMQGWSDGSCRVDNLIVPIKCVLGGVVVEGDFYDMGRGFDSGGRRHSHGGLTEN
jgi:hypothetical protein